MLIYLLYTGEHGHCSQQLPAEQKLFAFLTFVCSAYNQMSAKFIA